MPSSIKVPQRADVYHIRQHAAAHGQGWPKEVEDGAAEAGGEHPDCAQRGIDDLNELCIARTAATGSETAINEVSRGRGLIHKEDCAGSQVDGDIDTCGESDADSRDEVLHERRLVSQLR